MKKVATIVYILLSVKSFSQELVDFKLLKPKEEINAYLTTLAHHANWEIDTIKRFIDTDGSLMESLSLPLLEGKVLASLIVVHFIYVKSINKHICDVMSIAVESKHLDAYWAVFNKRYKRVKDHWEFDTGKEMAGKRIFYTYKVEVGQFSQLGYMTLKSSLLLK